MPRCRLQVGQYHPRWQPRRTVSCIPFPSRRRWDGRALESRVSPQAITDINTQEGKDSSGNPQPLYGNPNLAMLQEQLQSALTFVTSGALTATAGSGSPASWILQAPSASDTYTVAAGAFGTGSGGTGSSAAMQRPPP